MDRNGGGGQQGERAQPQSTQRGRPIQPITWERVLTISASLQSHIRQ